jgi:hypothetical protein
MPWLKKHVFKIAVLAVVAIVLGATFTIFAGSITDLFTSQGHVSLRQCYTPEGTWSKEADTVVRDINQPTDASATTSKDIYCDDENCVLWTDGAEAPGPEMCVASSSDVYANLLWDKTDADGGSDKKWADSDNDSTAISGEQIDGTHDNGVEVGNNNNGIGNEFWLNRYYNSPDEPNNHFPAMDVCKQKGSAWRLPTILELDSIRDMTVPDPHSQLPGIDSTYYWSSSESSASEAYYLRFYSGNVADGSKSGTARVRCVRRQ